MTTCPACGRTARQAKNGQTRAGSQRYRCGGCGRKYTPEPKARAYPSAVRAEALHLYGAGRSRRWIARQLGVAHQTVANWVAAHAAAGPEPPSPPAAPVEMGARDDGAQVVAQTKTGQTACR